VIEISLKPKSPAHSTETQLRFVSRLPVLRFHFPGKSVVCYLCEKTHFASSLLSFLLLLIKSQFSIISSQSKFFTFPSIFSLQRNPVIFSQRVSLDFTFSLLFLLYLLLPYVIFSIKFKVVYLNVLKLHHNGKTHVIETIIIFSDFVSWF
jgi:hypothetical protein